MAAKREYSEATKAAVMGALLTGQSAAAVAAAYKVPASTVRNWKREASLDSGVTASQKERIGHLIIDNLEAALETTRVMLSAFADKDWIRKQDASEVAVLYGVIQDKVFRVLEALPDGDGE
jgi:hypothetical protein